MGLLGTLVTFTTGSNTVADLNGNFSAIKTAFNTYAVLTDTSRTITAVNTFTAKQTFAVTATSGLGQAILASVTRASGSDQASSVEGIMQGSSGTGENVGLYGFGNSTGTSTGNSTGVLGLAGAQSVSTVPLMASFRSLGSGVGTTVTLGAGFYASNWGGSNTVATLCGVYVESITAGTANYAVYTAGTQVSSFGGSVLSRFATGGVGYATGAGGAITQGSSRTTGVTLNTVCGAITLVSAAGSATPASFTVTNSTVAATDTIRVVQKSGTDKYILLVTAVGAGSFEITFYTTGGTTTEQPVFNFAVMKAVAA